MRRQLIKWVWLGARFAVKQVIHQLLESRLCRAVLAVIGFNFQGRCHPGPCDKDKVWVVVKHE